MKLIDADELPKHKFVNTDSDFQKGWNMAIEAIVKNEPGIKEGKQDAQTSELPNV